MKASICDFCRTVIPESDRAATLYQIVISLVDDYLEPKKSNSLLFDAEHACRSCTVQAHEALLDLKLEMGGRQADKKAQP
jgi:hypothetical protein